jgi:hypothetical protein
MEGKGGNGAVEKGEHVSMRCGIIVVELGYRTRTGWRWQRSIEGKN